MCTHVPSLLASLRTACVNAVVRAEVYIMNGVRVYIAGTQTSLSMWGPPAAASPAAASAFPPLPMASKPFRNVRAFMALYVDQTGAIARFLAEGDSNSEFRRAVFTRPRKFGKSPWTLWRKCCGRARCPRASRHGAAVDEDCVEAGCLTRTPARVFLVSRLHPRTRRPVSTPSLLIARSLCT